MVNTRESLMDANRRCIDTKMIETRVADSQALMQTRNEVQRLVTLLTEHPGQLLPSLLRQADPKELRKLS